MGVEGLDSRLSMMRCVSLYGGTMSLTSGIPGRSSHDHRVEGHAAAVLGFPFRSAKPSLIMPNGSPSYSIGTMPVSTRAVNLTRREALHLVLALAHLYNEALAALDALQWLLVIHVDGDLAVAADAVNSCLVSSLNVTRASFLSFETFIMPSPQSQVENIRRSLKTRPRRPPRPCGRGASTRAYMTCIR